MLYAKLILYTILTTPLLVHANDINIITPDQLPKTVVRSFIDSGRGKLPTFPANYGADIAAKDPQFEDICQAKTGAQLTPFVAESSQDGPYYSYSISATFACLAPTLSIQLDNASAMALQNALPVAPQRACGVELKRASVLCYHDLDEICDGTVLVSYNERTTCEISDLRTNQVVATLVDIHGDPSGGINQDQGAMKLESQLPIYLDGRRDDVPGANCGGHRMGQLKGLSRRAANITCEVFDGPDAQCAIEGIIKVP
jgi:hypothetical protein